MQIIWDDNEKIFNIKNETISYVIGVLRNGHLAHFYYGPTLSGMLSSDMFRCDQNRGLTNYVYEGDMRFSLNLERLDFPCYGTSDYRAPAIDVTAFDGSKVVDFSYQTHRILDVKHKIPGLPTSHGTSALTLEIDLFDEHLGTLLTLSYTMFEASPVIVRSSRLQHFNEKPIQINRLMSAAIDLPDANWEWLQLNGDWTRERAIDVHPLHKGVQSIGSLRGASSAAFSPFVALKRPFAHETAGEVIGISLVYSGNFLIQGEVNNDDMTRVIVGIHPDHFQWQLNKNEIFYAPEALLCYSDKGLGAMSRHLHDFIRKHIILNEKECPVLLNNWEATYFDFDSEKILELAKSAKSLGVEMIVLDDGWFGNRNDDTTGLGDWQVNLRKITGGLSQLSDQIHALDLKFGLWIEPEMVNKNSNLYQRHPDWIIGDPHRRNSHGRNQFVLDFSRPEVVEAIYGQLIKVLDHAKVDYIKWDMNRNITEPFSFSLGKQRQGELFHRYILGVYDLYEQLTQRYPDIIFESCSAGGGRFDLGMLCYSSQVWTSDNTDAMERLKIQYGTSMIFPLSTMGSHVADVPNHQVKRMTGLKTRGDVAYFGTFGYELNVLKLSELDRSVVMEQINFFKTYRKLIHQGDFYRLISPFEGTGNETAWMVLSKNGEEGIVAWYQVLAKPNQGLFKLKLQGLEPQAMYAISGMHTVVTGTYLEQFGLLLKPSFNGIEYSGDAVGDYQSRIWTLTRIDFD